MHFDLGGTAKSQFFSHVRVHRRPVHRSLALGVSQVHRLVHDLQTSHIVVVELVEFRLYLPQNEQAHAPLVCTTFPPPGTGLGLPFGVYFSQASGATF
jgi:hypothetical protein